MHYAIELTDTSKVMVLKGLSPRHAIRYFETMFSKANWYENPKLMPLNKIIVSDKENARWIVQRVELNVERGGIFERVGKVRYYRLRT